MAAHTALSPVELPQHAKGNGMSAPSFPGLKCLLTIPSPHASKLAAKFCLDPHYSAGGKKDSLWLLSPLANSQIRKRNSTQNLFSVLSKDNRFPHLFSLKGLQKQMKEGSYTSLKQYLKNVVKLEGRHLTDLRLKVYFF